MSFRISFKVQSMTFVLEIDDENQHGKTHNNFLSKPQIKIKRKDNVARIV